MKLVTTGSMWLELFISSFPVFISWLFPVSFSTRLVDPDPETPQEGPADSRG